MGATGGRQSTVLVTALRGQVRRVLLASALVTVHQVAEVLVPVTIGVVIDRAIAPGDAGQAFRWLLVLAGQFVVLSAAGCVGLYVDERARLEATHATRLRLAERVLDPGGGVEQALPGEVVSLSTVETARIGDGVGAVVVGVGAVTGVLASAAVLLTTSLWLGLAVVLGLPVVLLVVQALAEPLVARADQQQQALGTASGVAADLLRGLRVVKGLGAEAAASARYRTASRRAQGAGLAANRARSGYAGLMVSIAGGFVVMVGWLGARQALDGAMSVGQLVAALGVTQFLVGPLGRVAYAGSELAQARAASGRLDAALSAPPGVVGGERSLPVGAAGALRVDGLRHKSLRDVSFAVSPGELVGVAAEPVDAAALVEVLDRSAEPEAGVVLVDGIPHAELPLDDARRVVAVAHHDAPLLGRSILDDVAAAAPPDYASLGPVLAAASLDDVVEAVPGGIEGALSEDGRSLSGGQRQRVVLARALATEAPVLVMHEPTTAVDTATEHRIAAGIRSVRHGRTTLLVTTSPTLLALADRVVVVRDGRVVAEGDHAELTAATGVAGS